MNEKAFPSTFHNGWGEPEKGMTLRDYFAAKAMQAFISSPSLKDDANEYAVAASSYKVADAMLKARQE